MANRTSTGVNLSSCKLGAEGNDKKSSQYVHHINCSVQAVASICEAFATCDNLTSLKLQSCQLHIKAIEVIALSLKSSSLLSIDLRDNRIDAAGAKVFAVALRGGVGGEETARLKRLDLRSNRIDTKGAAALAAAIAGGPFDKEEEGQQLVNAAASEPRVTVRTPPRRLPSPSSRAGLLGRVDALLMPEPTCWQNAVLQTLELGGNNAWDDEAYRAFGAMLKSKETSLRSLSLPGPRDSSATHFFTPLAHDQGAQPALLPHGGAPLWRASRMRIAHDLGTQPLAHNCCSPILAYPTAALPSLRIRLLVANSCDSLLTFRFCSSSRGWQPYADFA